MTPPTLRAHAACSVLVLPPLVACRVYPAFSLFFAMTSVGWAAAFDAESADPGPQCSRRRTRDDPDPQRARLFVGLSSLSTERGTVPHLCLSNAIREPRARRAPRSRLTDRVQPIRAACCGRFLRARRPMYWTSAYNQVLWASSC